MAAQEAVVKDRPDWMLSSFLGLTKDIESIYKDGMKIGDFEIAGKDTYWGKQGIKDMFKDSQGAEDYNTFSKTYDTERFRFLKLRQAEYDVNNYNAQFINATAERLGETAPVPNVQRTSPDMWGRTYGYDFSDGTGFSKKQRGWRETAIDTGVKTAEGKYIHPKEFSGLSKFAVDNTGSIKLNEDGKPYLEPVKDGEEVKSFEQIYTPMSEWWGYYGHDYEWKHLAGSLVKNAVGFFAQTADALAEFPKAVLQFTGEGDKSQSYKNIVDFENWVKQYNPSLTEEGIEGGFFSLESLTDLSQQVIWQLASMVITGGSVGTVAKILGAGAKAGKIGSVAGRLFMTGIAAGPIAEVSRDSGLSGREAATLLGMTSIALYPIMALEELVAYNKFIGISQAQIADAIKKSSKIIVKKGVNNRTARAYISNLNASVKNILYKASKTPSVLTSAAAESLEETAEQVVDLGIRNLYNLYSNTINEDSWVAKQLGTNKETVFNFNWVDEAKALGLSAVGGAIGGSIAGPLMRKLRKQQPQLAYSAEEMVIDGKENVLYRYINDMEQQGRLDYTFKDSNDEYTPEQDKSRNKEAGNILRGWVNYMVELRDSQQLDKLYENNKTKARDLEEVLKTSSVGKDAALLFSEINELKERQNEAIATNTALNDTDVEEIRKLIEEKQSTLDSIKRGEFVADYTTEGLYNLNSIARNSREWNRNKLSGKNFVNLSKATPTFVNAANEEIKKENNDLFEASNSATVENYSRLTSEGKEKILGDADNAIKDSYEQLKPHVDVLEKAATEANLEFGINIDELLDPETRELQIFNLEQLQESVNKDIYPLVTNMIQADQRKKAIEKFEPSELTAEMKQSDLMLNMVSFTDENRMSNTKVPISKKVSDELALREEMTQKGVSLYSNTPQLIDILRSTEARIAQVLANPVVLPQVKTLYEANEQTPAESITSEQQEEYLNELRTLHAETLALLDESQINANSAEKRIRDATVGKFRSHREKLDTIQNHFSDTDFAQISTIIAGYNDTLDEKLSEGDIEGYFFTQRQLEHSLYEYGNGDRNTILRTFNFGKAEAHEILNGEHDQKLAAYDYMRGVLAVSSNDIWNAYRDVIINSSLDTVAASDEQLTGIVSAVQGLMAQNYETFERDYPFQTNHHNSYFMDSPGGVGKTTVMAPIVAGIMQRLTGGKVFLTSRGNIKTAKVRTDFNNFFRTPEGAFGISGAKAVNEDGSQKNIREFLESPEDHADTNLIVYDEVTLLGTRQLDIIQKNLDQINAARRSSPDLKPPLKILYTGDTNQNSPSQGEGFFDQVQGINDRSRHQIARGEPVTYSFREGNQQLRLFNAYSRDIQKQEGTSDPIITEYRGYRGVRVVTDRQKFLTAAAKLVNQVKADGQLDNLVYITDRSRGSLPNGISMALKDNIMTTEEAQGEEWKYVIYDPQNDSVFSKRSNIVPKKQLHTASTRAGDFFLVYLGEHNGIKSKEGKIYNVVPLKPSTTTKDAQIKRVSNILGGSSKEISEVKVGYDGFEVSQTQPEDAPPDTDQGPEPTFDTSTTEGKFADYIQTRNKKNDINLHTFFTVEGQNEIKNRAIYDQILKRPDRENHRYRIGIAKIGTPEYTNLINNDPSYNGTYAIFIEGEVGGQSAVLGTLSHDNDFQQFIEENGIMEGRDRMFFSIDRSFLYGAKNFRPTVKFNSPRPRPLGDIIERYGDNITFGDVRVATQEVLTEKNDGRYTANSGEILLPISTAYTQRSDIEKEYATKVRSRLISLIPVNKTQVPVSVIENELREFMRGSTFDMQEGKFVYATMFGHETMAVKLADGTKDIGRMVKTINDVYNSISPNDAEYKSFVKTYTQNQAPEKNDYFSADKFDEAVSQSKEIPKESADKPFYLFADYMESKKKTSGGKTKLFQRLLADIQKDERYRNGFWFNPRLELHTTDPEKNNTHGTAHKGMDRLYQTYLSTDVDFVTPPSISISKPNLLLSLSKGIRPTTPSVDTSVTEDGKMTEVNEDGTGDGDNYVDPNISLASPEPTSLLDYQRSFFKGPLAVTAMPESISRFKRAFYDSFFNQLTGRIESASDGVNILTKRLEDRASQYEGDLSELDVIGNEGDRSIYIDHVISKNLPFLISKYAPTVQFKSIEQPDGTVVSDWRYTTEFVKNKSFNDKESFSLLKEGLTEMVRTQIENTPVLQKIGDNEYKETGRYLSPRSDVEKIVKAFKEAKEESKYNHTRSIVDILQGSDSEILQSLYVKFYADKPVTVNGELRISLDQFTDSKAFPIIDAMSVFFSSGEVFTLGFVDQDTSENKLPINEFWKDRTFVYENGQQGMQTVADNVRIGSIIMSSTDKGKTYTINGNSYTKGQLYTTPAVLQAFADIGMPFITEEHLDNMLTYSSGLMQITSTDDVERVIQRNSFLMNNIIFRALSNIKSDNIQFIQNTPALYNAVARVNGIHVGMEMLNVDGNRVYRLRNTSPIFTINKRIKESAGDPRFAVNMLVNHYNITDFFLKDGFKDKVRGKSVNKSNNSLSWEETLEYDLIWNFADTLERTNGRAFAVPLMVYSDGASDITPIIRFKEPHSPFTSKAIKEIEEKLFNSRVDYYSQVEWDVVRKWNSFLGTSYITIGSIQKHLSESPQSVDEVASFETGEDGMVKNLDYISDQGNAVLNPLLVKDIRFYKHGNLDKFQVQLSSNFAEFKQEVDRLDARYGTKSKISARTSRNVDDVIKAFYYNWVAVSTEATIFSMGNSNQYKGSDKSGQYIDFTKRAKAEMSNHTSQIFRDSLWMEMRNQANLEGRELTDKELYEGYKLSRNYKVAYVNDPVEPLNSLAGEFKAQEVYDGATFVTPLTRIFQRASNGGDYGTNISHIMKNITTSQRSGVTTFIKNAEFELTPTILQNGTQRAIRIARNMLDQKFNPVMAQDMLSETDELVEIDSAYTYMTRALGMKEDFSNVEYDHFGRLAEFLVRNGLQDTPILEILPDTSVKTGGGTQNNIEGDSYTPQTIDIFNKGTQLDASKDPTKGKQTTATSQLFNTLGINWRLPDAVGKVHKGLADLADAVSREYSGLVRSVDGIVDRLKKLVRTSSDANNNAITYQHKLIETDYSLDDRQILNKAISQLNAELAKQAISPKFEGTQYIIHPSNGLIRPYELDGKTYTKKNAPQGAMERELKWQAPTRNGIAVDAQNEDGSYIIPEYQALIDARGTDLFKEAQLNLDRLLQEDGWESGIAEIMLPAEMQKDFGMREGMNIEDITPEFFALQIRSLRESAKQKPLTDANLKKRADMMFESFQKRLEGIMIRIPTTGKHSAVVTKIAAFVQGSDNAAFVPAELLMIQGADQDIDKGSYLTYEVISGIIPEVDENNELISSHKQLIPKSRHAEARTAGIKNKIVDGIREAIESPLNTVEANISVDAAMDTLKSLRDSRQSSTSFDRDSYISYAQMHEINQAGKALVGIFANGLKAYQVMYDTFKSQGEVDNDLLSGLGDDFNETWIRFAGLINAATDNAKEQILGTIGINIYNANMVSYLVSRGMSFNTIVDFLEVNKEDLQKLQDLNRYDSNTEFFDPEKVWKNNPDLVNVYKRGEEYAMLANILSINRDLPNSSYDMYRYKEGIEKFVNDALTKEGVVKNSNFSFITFINNDGYADQYIDLYEELLNSNFHDYNILRVLKGSTHIRAYTKVYSTSYAAVNKVSNITRISNKIAEKLRDKRVSEDTYRDLTEFVYGLAVSEYMESKVAINNRFDLGTIDGRNNFVGYMGDMTPTGHIAYLKAKYPDNAFVQSGMFVENVKRYKYENAPQLRTHELNNMNEQELLALQVGFEILEDVDKTDLVNYALITRKGAMGRGSIAQLFDPEDTKDFNEFLKEFDSEELSDRYDSYRKNSNETDNYHNSIPYSMTEDAPEGDKGVKVINSGQAYVINSTIGKLGVNFKVGSNSKVTNEVISQIETALTSSKLKSKDKEKLSNVYRSLTDQSASNKKTDTRIRNCE